MQDLRSFFKTCGVSLITLSFLRNSKAATPEVVYDNRTKETIIDVNITNQLLIKYDDNTVDLNRYGTLWCFIAQAFIPDGKCFVDSKVHRFESSYFTLDKLTPAIEREFKEAVISLCKKDRESFVSLHKVPMVSFIKLSIP